MWLNGILRRDWFGIQTCSLQWVCNFHQCTIELQCAHSASLDSLFYIWLDRISRYYCIDTLWCWNWGFQYSAYCRYQTTLFYSFHLQTFYILHMVWVDTTAWILCDTEIVHTRLCCCMFILWKKSSITNAWHLYQDNSIHIAATASHFSATASHHMCCGWDAYWVITTSNLHGIVNVCYPNKL